MASMSCPCNKSELDLFTVPPTQVTIQRSRYNRISTKGVVETQGILFEHTGQENWYLDLAKSYLKIKVKIEGGAATAEVGPVNLFAHSLFEQISLSLNGKEVSSSNKDYPYQALLSTLLSYGNEAKSSQLVLSGYSKDTAGKMNELAGDDGRSDNAGLAARAGTLRTGEIREFIMKPNLAFFNQERLIPSHIDLKLELYQSRPTFNMMAPNTATFKPVILDIDLYVHEVAILPSLVTGHALQREKNPLVYPLKRLDTQIKTASRGDSTFSGDFFFGKAPNKVFVLMVEEGDRRGTYKQNPFNFQHFNLSSIQLRVAGVSVPERPIQLDFAKKQYADAYLQLFNEVSGLFEDRGLDITLEDFANGYCILAFNLDPDSNDGAHLEVYKKGPVNVELRFGTGLAKAISVMVLGEFENTVSIDRDGNIFKDF